MSQSEDDDYAFFGTPLEQFEEGIVLYYILLL